jgi:hypothetical protein
MADKPNEQGVGDFVVSIFSSILFLDTELFNQDVEVRIVPSVYRS